jgi:hypothetical protein
MFLRMMIRKRESQTPKINENLFLMEERKDLPWKK